MQAAAAAVAEALPTRLSSQGPPPFPSRQRGALAQRRQARPPASLGPPALSEPRTDSRFAAGDRVAASVVPIDGTNRRRPDEWVFGFLMTEVLV